ncbi:MAG TPA: type II toxin-antitoxin system VapC family toxin [Pseudonocardiaceae bacterium]|nr:type II toxin-antitoxin system VapC family toxin [Pseudonocardiaceae bacterium]
MPLLYADTSAVVGAYFPDEADHQTLHRLLLAGDDPVVTSELTRLEFASAVSSGYRGLRIADPEALLANFDADCAENGPFTLLSLDSATMLPLARKLVTEHPLRSLDALHLATAVARSEKLAGGEVVAMVTRDQRQATAAKACGLRVL